MKLTQIARTSLPDPPETLSIVSNDGQPIGTLRFTSKNGITSVLEYVPGQEPHRTYPLRAKHRPR